MAGDGAEAVLVGQQDRVIAVLAVQSLGHRVIFDSGKGVKQAVGGHGPGIPVTAFIFVVRVALFPIVPCPEGFHNVQPLFFAADGNQMAGHLVLNAGPDLVAVHKGEGRLAAPGPAAQQKPALFPKGVARALGIVVGNQVPLEIVTVHGKQVAFNFFRV